MVSSLYWDSSVSYEQRYAIIPNVQLSGNQSCRFIHWTVGEETDSEQGARNFNYMREKNYSSTSDWSRSSFDALKTWPEINRLIQHSVSEFKCWLVPQFLFCITIADFLQSNNDVKKQPQVLHLHFWNKTKEDWRQKTIFPQAISSWPKEVHTM